MSVTFVLPGRASAHFIAGPFRCRRMKSPHSPRNNRQGVPTALRDATSLLLARKATLLLLRTGDSTEASEPRTGAATPERAR